jgi:peptidoglycan hydrolase-like protein with peptidoglycan-binding domain
MSKELFLTLVLSLGVSTASGETYELDLSNMPRSICGFPSLHTGGKFPEWNTRAAQRLLSFALSEDIPADGVFSDETTAQIEAFQQQAGLTVDGYLNINSWPTLLALATPLEPKATGSPVLALQDLLANTYGYGALASLSGVYDEATELAVADFQRRRKMDVNVAGAVDAETWHLLLTQCDNNPGNPNAGHYWFDAGWPQGNVSVATLECLQASGFEYAVFECWRNNNGGTFWAECVENVENAWKAGYDAVDVYMFPDRYYAADVQVRQLVANLTAADVKYGAIMIDM